MKKIEDKWDVGSLFGSIHILVLVRGIKTNKYPCACVLMCYWIMLKKINIKISHHNLFKLWQVQIIFPYSAVALFARPSSHISSQSHESSLPLSPSRMGLELSGTPRSSESSSASEVTVNVPTSPSSCVVKEEPCDMSAVFIGWEMSEEGSVHHQEGADMPSQDNRIPSEKRNVFYLFYF